MIAPTRRTALLVAVVAGASFVVSDVVAVAAVLVVLVAAAVDGLSTRQRHEATRTMEPVLSRGVPTDLAVSTSTHPGRTTVRQPGTPDLLVESTQHHGRLRGSVTAVRRGHHELPPVAVRLSGPLGLAQTTRTVGESMGVQVFPDMIAARHIAAQVRTNTFQFAGLRIRGALGLGTAFDSLREYVDGDDVRRVNWLATARHTTPMVNQYRVDQDRDVICVIDCGRLMGAPIGDMSRLDAAVDAAAAVAAVADVVGDRVGVVAFDREVLRDLPPLRRGGEAVARAIFDLEPSPFESNYLLVFERVATAKRAFVLVLTDLLDDAAARPIGGAIPALGRKHEVALATVADPDVRAALRDTPESLEEAARALVAVDVVTERDKAAAQIRRHGARVIDASPKRLGAACVAAYLDAKARVRI